MVSNVGFAGSYSDLGKYSDYENLAKYSLGTTIINTQDNPFEGMPLMLGITGGIEAFKLGKWAIKANKTKGGLNAAWSEQGDIFQKELTTKQKLFADGGITKAETYKNIWRTYSADTVIKAVPEDKLEKYTQETRDLYSNAKKAAEIAKANPENVTAIKEANAFLAKADALAQGQIKAEGFGKVGEFLGKITGLSKASGAIKAFAVDSPAVASLLKFGKGNGIFLAITGGLELFTQVIPAFGLGADKGIKQVFKSTVKTAASVGGWVGGAAIGAAIGSVIPGAGTVVGGAIGAVLGLVGGFIGSWVAGKAADAVVGKSEVEIAQEEEAKKVAKEAEQNPEVAQNLIQTAQSKLQDDNSEDAQIASNSISRLTALTAQRPQAQSLPIAYGQQYLPMNNELSSQLAYIQMYNQLKAQNNFAS